MERDNEANELMKQLVRRLCKTNELREWDEMIDAAFPLAKPDDDKPSTPSPASRQNNTPGTDPRRLTDEEILHAYAMGYSGKTVDPHTGALDAHAAKLAAGLRAVYNLAQRERDRVRVSRDDLRKGFGTDIGYSPETIAAWLRSIGVEVEP